MDYATLFHDVREASVDEASGNVRVVFDQDHENVFESEFLRRNAHDADLLEKKNESLSSVRFPSTWRRSDDSKPQIDATNLHVTHEPNYVHFQKDMLLPKAENPPTSSTTTWLRAINADGLAVIRGTPTESGTVAKLASSVGAPSHDLYGTTFDVVSTKNPINVAYTSEGLDFHVDLVYYESPPGLQFLHCLQFDEDVRGGESTFVDGVAAAEAFRRVEPYAFDTLSRVPATFQKHHADRDHPVRMVYQRPHFDVHPRYGSVVGVHWAPMFEGPLRASRKEADAYYRSKSRFVEFLEKECDEFKLCFKLEKGDCVVFNNRRMLHGRNAFSVEGSGKTIADDDYARWLQGCYLNVDDYLNAFRVRSGVSPESGDGLYALGETRTGSGNAY